MSVHSFGELTQSFAQAVIQAHKASEEQHIGVLNRFFNEVDGKQVPKTVTMKVPNQSGSQGDDVTMEVPLISLVPFNSIMISEVEIEFHTSLASADSPEAGKPSDIKLNVGGGGMLGARKNNVKVNIKMRGTNPPEGLIRVNDNIIKRIP